MRYKIFVNDRDYRGKVEALRICHFDRRYLIATSYIRFIYLRIFCHFKTSFHLH